MEEKSWRHYNAAQLEIKVRNNPLTREGMDNLIKNSNIKVRFVEMESHKRKGVSMFCGCEDSTPRYRVLINSLTSEEEQRITLAHELVHLYYRCGGTILNRPEDIEVEDIIERETSKFMNSFPPSLSDFL